MSPSRPSCRRQTPAARRCRPPAPACLRRMQRVRAVRAARASVQCTEWRAGNVREAISHAIEDDVVVIETTEVTLAVTQLELADVDAPASANELGHRKTARHEMRRRALSGQ